jgi:hypothetical protein
MDSEVIRNIPLSTRVQEDFWAWHFEKNGVFLVRSAHRMLVTTKNTREDWLDSRSASSGSVQDSKSQTKLWKILVHAKLHIFCGGLLSILCPQMICATEGIWRDHQPAHYVGRRTHGDIRSWSVKYQGAFGHLRKLTSRSTSPCQRNLM